MFTSGEMEVLSSISFGYDEIKQISEKTGKSIPQTYKAVASLHKKDTAHLSEGKVIPERKTHLTLLLDILRRSDYARVSLSGQGIDILGKLIEPKKVSEISSGLGLHQTSVSRKLRQLEAIGMVKNDGRSYIINDKLWPDLRPMINAYLEYYQVNDVRAPPGSKIYYSSGNMVLFEDNRISESSKTAFSKYDEYGIKFYTGTYFCISPPANVTLCDAFIHSL